jgi:dCTP deaminase
MSKFLTSKEIKDKLNQLFESDYDQKCVKEIMYDLRLGNNVYITPEKKEKIIKDEETIQVNPGAYALLLTKEKLSLPNNIFGLITIKFAFKKKGLVNISGFHVDPGFKGPLIFSVYNLGPSTICLRSGDEVFSILFYELGSNVELIKDRHIEKIPLDMLEPLIDRTAPSMIELNKKIQQLDLYVKVIAGAFVTLVISFVGSLIFLLIDRVSGG